MINGSYAIARRTLHPCDILILTLFLTHSSPIHNIKELFQDINKYFNRDKYIVKLGRLKIKKLD